VLGCTGRFCCRVLTGPCPKYAAVEPDLSALVPDGLSFAAVRRGIAGPGIVVSIDLTDVYEGEKNSAREAESDAVLEVSGPRPNPYG
jgi:hypothetical protein